MQQYCLSHRELAHHPLKSSTVTLGFAAPADMSLFAVHTLLMQVRIEKSLLASRTKRLTYRSNAFPGVLKMSGISVTAVSYTERHSRFSSSE